MRLKATIASLASGLLLALLAPAAYAWTAVAISAGGDHVHVSSGSPTKEGAEAGVTVDCKIRAASDCRLIKSVPNGAIVVVRPDSGDGGTAYFGADVNPSKAREQALQSCKATEKGCAVIGAVWDPGTPWTAITYASGAAFGFRSEEGAEDATVEAMKMCERHADDPAACVPHSGGAFEGLAHIAIASDAAKSSFAVSSVSLDDAKGEALLACKRGQSEGAGECKLVFEISSLPVLAEPASFRAIEAEARVNLRGREKRRLQWPKRARVVPNVSKP